MKAKRRKLLEIGSYTFIVASMSCLFSSEVFAKKVSKEYIAKNLVSKPTNSSEPVDLKVSVKKGLAWLVKAQHKDGSWGAGAHSNQRNRDPHNVKADPATTALAAMTLIRGGHTPYAGEYKAELLKATEYMLELVKKSNPDSPKLSNISGTQPQSKLGQNIDVSLAVQYFSRLVPLLKENDPMTKRVDTALDKVIAKMQLGQAKDGRVKGAGWAGVLQSSVNASALDMAQRAGKKVDRDAFNKSLAYNKAQFDSKTKRARTKDAAGIELYSWSSSQRANAVEVREANEILDQAKKEGKLPAAAVISEENLIKAGVEKKQARKLKNASDDLNVQNERLNDQRLLNGFGNNGGEEFLSYLQTSESLIISRSKEWKTWSKKIYTRLAKVQNPNGSWSGHHCITSPVFCTAASLMCMTVENDADYLRQKETVAKN